MKVEDYRLKESIKKRGAYRSPLKGLLFYSTVDHFYYMHTLSLLLHVQPAFWQDTLSP